MKRSLLLHLAVVLGFALIGAAPVGQAAVPEGINYQAYLTNADGSPINSTVSITFAAYNVDVGGVPLWNSTESISPDNGLFSVTLGNPVNPFPAGLFDTPVFIGLFVAGEELLPRRALKSSAFAFKAADADTLTGATAADLDQSTEVSNLQSVTDNLMSEVDDNSSTISSLNADVSANTSVIGQIEGTLDEHDDRLAGLEANPGDITGVSAGSGLSGGASSGNATISIATGGVTSQMLAANSVGSNAIIDGSITGADLSPSSIYTLGDTTTDDLTARGQVSIQSPLDLEIFDDFHGLRWFTSDGVTNLASIEVRAQDTTFRDNARNRVIVRSNGNGIGIGTDQPSPGFAVTVPSLRVTDDIDIGYVRVSTSYAVDLTNASCHSHGNQPCFYGTGTAVCPVGTKILGGGSSGTSGLFGSIASAAPNTDTSFLCGVSYDIPNATRFCYAICARVD